jgi:deoxyribonuclease V
MILAVDVGYEGQGAHAAGVLFDTWECSESRRQIVLDIPIVEEYVPGSFYRRELPCIEKVLAAVHEKLECIIVDGYVSLGEPPVAGLGWHLWEILSRATPVIGVAKSAFVGTPASARVCRGASSRPLFVTSAGMSPDDAKARVVSMHGKYRMPELLKLVDRLSRRR